MRTKILVGNALEVLPHLPERHFHTIICSPPYLALRDYRTPATVWGGDPNCDHAWETGRRRAGRHGDTGDQQSSRLQGKGSQKATRIGTVETARCRDCGAFRGQLGMEDSPEQYVQNLSRIFGEAHRVLRDDGTLWVVIGDSYVSDGGNPRQGQTGLMASRKAAGERRRGAVNSRVPHLKDKDLIGIPWRTAFALQGFSVLPGDALAGAADWLAAAEREGDWETVRYVAGLLRAWSELSLHLSPYWLRSDVIWHKPNATPASVRDRCTSAHEYVFMLAKRKTYYFDTEAIAEPATGRWSGSGPETDAKYAGMRSLYDGMTRIGPKATRNRRSVWSISTAGLKDAHFAAFPVELVETCLLASTSQHGVCPRCGAPWVRLTRPLHPQGEGLSEATWRADAERTGVTGGDARGGRLRSGLDRKSAEEKSPIRVTIGWRPTCRHYDAEYRRLPRARDPRKRHRQDAAGSWFPRARRRPGNPEWPVEAAEVLDLFGGAMTTAVVAQRHGRRATCIELNPSYATEIGLPRLQRDDPLFSEIYVGYVDDAQPTEKEKTPSAETEPDRQLALFERTS